MKPATLEVSHPYGIDEWNLIPECIRIAEPIASKLGLPINEFLTRLSCGEYDHHLDEGHLTAESAPDDFEVTLPSDPHFRDRILRAARIQEQSLKDYVWRAIASDTLCTEESYIFSSDGEVIGDALDLQPFKRWVQRHERWEITTRATIKGETKYREIEPRGND